MPFFTVEIVLRLHLSVKMPSEFFAEAQAEGSCCLAI